MSDHSHSLPLSHKWIDMYIHIYAHICLKAVSVSVSFLVDFVRVSCVFHLTYLDVCWYAVSCKFISMLWTGVFFPRDSCRYSFLSRKGPGSNSFPLLIHSGPGRTIAAWRALSLAPSRLRWGDEDRKLARSLEKQSLSALLSKHNKHDSASPHP